MEETFGVSWVKIKSSISDENLNSYSFYREPPLSLKLNMMHVIQLDYQVHTSIILHTCVTFPKSYNLLTIENVRVIFKCHLQIFIISNYLYHFK